MFVRDHMTSPAVTINPEMPFQEALRLMQDHDFGRLPVVDKGKLVGIVSERDLLYASPSPATTLSVWEMNYLLSKLQIKKLMTKEVIITTPDTTVEDAAQIMMQHKVSGLPVIEDDKIIGMITETDLFKTMIELLGGEQQSLRLTLEVPQKKGVLAQLSSAIFDLGGDIVSVGTFPIEGKPEEAGIIVKVQDVNKDKLINTLETLGDHVVDARQ